MLTILLSWLARISIVNHVVIALRVENVSPWCKFEVSSPLTKAKESLRFKFESDLLKIFHREESLTLS